MARIPISLQLLDVAHLPEFADMVADKVADRILARTSAPTLSNSEALNTSKETCRRANLSGATLARMIRDERIRSVLVGRARRIPESEVQRLIRGEIQPPPRPKKRKADEPQVVADSKVVAPPRRKKTKAESQPP